MNHNNDNSKTTSNNLNERGTKLDTNAKGTSSRELNERAAQDLSRNGAKSDGSSERPVNSQSATPRSDSSTR